MDNQDSSDQKTIIFDKNAHVAVIGAGIAGGCVACALTRRGVNVTLIDSASAPGSGASGNPIALLAPRLPRTRSPIGRLMASAYLYAVRFYDELEDAGASAWSGARGAFAMARNPDESERQHRASAAFDLPKDVMRLVDYAEATELTGVPIPMGGLWFERAGALCPPEIIAALTSGITYSHANVAKFQEIENGINIIDEDDGSLGKFDGIVVAAGVGVMDLMPDQSWPLRANRGQLAYLPALNLSPRVPVTYGGYVSPLVDIGDGQQGHVLGATYARRDEVPDAEWANIRESDNADMMENLQAHLPALSPNTPIGGRTALRATIRDYMPLAGKVVENLYVLGGLGSRGFLTAPILAEMIASQMTGGSLPLEDDIVSALDPARFKSQA